MIQKFNFYILLVSLFCNLSFAFEATTVKTAAIESSTDVSSKNVKYKSSGDVNFDELLIQGQIKRPELSVVTGNSSKGSDGLLRLRDHFIDRIQMDGGEEL